MRKVVILNSSPRRNGNSDVLSETVAAGVRENGGEAEKFDLAQMNINPCKGCYACQMGRGNPCVQKDDMKQVYDAIEQADAVVLATPLYWQQMNGIMKNAIDRIFAMAGKLDRNKDTALIVSGATPGGQVYDKIESYFREAFAGPEVLGWNVASVIRAGGLGGIGDAKNSAHYESAYKLGKELAETR